MSKIKYIILCAFLISFPTPASADVISNTSFEDGTFSDWNTSETGSVSNNTIAQNGVGTTIINAAVTFNAPARGAVGSPTLSNGFPNPYYAPAVIPTVWTFSPYGNYAAFLQPMGTTTFDSATGALGLTSAENASIKATLIAQQQASGLGDPDPTNAAWITKSVTLTAGTVYTMSWNYIGTDYVPFNDGSITSLTYAGSGNPTITVNNGNSRYALLGFTNPGTGDYSTGTYGSTGWQVSTYQVSVTGTYLLGFAVFNLGDTSLSPVLLVDSQPGSTTKNGQTFGAVTPNNPNAPVVTTVPPTTTEPPTTTTEPPATTTEPPTTTTEAPIGTTTQPAVELPIPSPVVSEPEQTVLQPEISQAPQLPITGSNSRPSVAIGLLLVTIGLAFIFVIRKVIFYGKIS